MSVPASLLAQEYYDEAPSEYEEILREPASELPATLSHVSGFDLRAFYAESDLRYFKDSTDFYGLSASYVVRQNHMSKESQTLSPEFFISGAFGFGSGDISDASVYDDDYYQFEARHFMCTLGANLRYNIGSAFSLYVGARMGGEFFLLSVDDEDGYDQDADFGLVYGFGMGCSLNLTESFSLTMSVERLSSEATPEVDIASLPEQNYTVYSLGVCFTF